MTSCPPTAVPRATYACVCPLPPPPHHNTRGILHGKLSQYIGSEGAEKVAVYKDITRIMTQEMFRHADDGVQALHKLLAATLEPMDAADARACVPATFGDPCSLVGGIGMGYRGVPWLAHSVRGVVVLCVCTHCRLLVTGSASHTTLGNAA